MYDWLTDTHAMLLEMLSHLKTCWEKYNADMTTIQYDDDDKQHPRRDWIINKLTVRAKNISFHPQDSRISYASPSHIVGLFHYQKCCEEKHDKNSPEMRLQFISFYHLQFAQTPGRHVCTSSFPFISSDGSYFIAKNIDDQMKLGK